MSEAFRLAYQTDPAWATANLTTWMVYVGAAAALANVAVVISAFAIQRRAFDREATDRAFDLAKLHASALRSAQNALQIYDAVLGVDLEKRREFSRSDAIGRLKVLKRFIDHYLAQGIIETGVPYALVTVLTLIERAIADIEGMVPASQDALPAEHLRELREFRRDFRTKAENILNLAVEMCGGKPSPDEPPPTSA